MESRLLPIDRFEALDGSEAPPGSLILSGWRATRMVYFAVDLQGQLGLLPLADLGDRPFNVVPVGKSVGTFLAVHDAELLVDIEKMYLATEGDLRPGLAFVAGTSTGLVARVGYGTTFITQNGEVLKNPDLSSVMLFEGWRFTVADNQGKQVVLVDSRLGVRY